MKKSKMFVGMLLMKVLGCVVVVAMDDFRRGFEQFKRDGERSVGAYMEERREQVAQLQRNGVDHSDRALHDHEQQAGRMPTGAAMGSQQVATRRCPALIAAVKDGFVCCCQECVCPCLKLTGTYLGVACLKCVMLCAECYLRLTDGGRESENHEQ